MRCAASRHRSDPQHAAVPTTRVPRPHHGSRADGAGDRAQPGSMARARGAVRDRSVSARSPRPGLPHTTPSHTGRAASCRRPRSRSTSGQQRLSRGGFCSERALYQIRCGSHGRPVTTWLATTLTATWGPRWTSRVCRANGSPRTAHRFIGVAPGRWSIDPSARSELPRPLGVITLSARFTTWSQVRVECCRPQESGTRGPAPPSAPDAADTR